LADRRVWPALVVREQKTIPAQPSAAPFSETVSAILDDYSPIAIEDLAPLPLPPGGLWDPTFPPPPEPPPSPLHWRVFFTAQKDRDAAATALRAAEPALVLDAEDVPDEDWAARSQRELTAIAVGTFIVAPPWDVPDTVASGHTIIIIEPSRGFGTGHHPSTRLCLRALSSLDVAGRAVLDLGTGSGVLAIAAALKSAAHVVAVDIDPDAIEAARVSHQLNPRAGKIDWLIGDFRDVSWTALPTRTWDVIFANLTGGMLRSSAHRIRELLARGGLLIVSGFDEQERASVESALDLPRRADYVEDGWVGLVLQQETAPDP
jgi:ribosomal protein L11 methyltransferase